AGQGLHFGVDFNAPCGTPVVAIGDGVVFAVDGPYGAAPHNVVIAHPDGLYSLYGHLLERAPLTPGQPVHRGNPLARSGEPAGRCDADPHLHLEIRRAEMRETVNPVPLIALDWQRATLGIRRTARGGGLNGPAPGASMYVHFSPGGGGAGRGPPGLSHCAGGGGRQGGVVATASAMYGKQIWQAALQDLRLKQAVADRWLEGTRLISLDRDTGQAIVDAPDTFIVEQLATPRYSGKVAGSLSQLLKQPITVEFIVRKDSAPEDRATGARPAATAPMAGRGPRAAPAPPAQQLEL